MLDRYDPEERIEKTFLYWLRRRSDAQYVDIRGDEVDIPHELFDRTDAEGIMAHAEPVLGRVERLLEER